MDTVEKRFQPGTTYDQHMKLEKQLRNGWTMMWIATGLLIYPYLFFITIPLALTACGFGLGTSAWPGFRKKGLKLAFWAIMGPLTPVILFVVAGMIVGALR
jgi:hypothetical protein